MSSIYVEPKKQKITKKSAKKAMSDSVLAVTKHWVHFHGKKLPYHRELFGAMH